MNIDLWIHPLRLFLPESKEFSGPVYPRLDWPSEPTVGMHINTSHQGATPPGLEVTAKVELIEVSGRKLVFVVRLVTV